MTRLELVEAALTGGEASVISRWPAQVPVYGFAAGDALTPLALRTGRIGMY